MEDWATDVSQKQKEGYPCPLALIIIIIPLCEQTGWLSLPSCFHSSSVSFACMPCFEQNCTSCKVSFFSILFVSVCGITWPFVETMWFLKIQVLRWLLVLFIYNILVQGESNSTLDYSAWIRNYSAEVMELIVSRADAVYSLWMTFSIEHI